MVFCNTLDSCRATEHAVQEAGLPTRCYHGDVPLQVCDKGGPDCRAWSETRMSLVLQMLHSA